MTESLISRLPQVGVTIFSVMTARAQEHGALNLAQGFPDFDADPRLLDEVTRAMREGHNQYAPMPGVLHLREVIAAYVQELYGAAYNPADEITVTSGGTEALFDALAAVVHPGDEVMVLEPCYDSYAPAIMLCGGVVVPVPLMQPCFAVDWDAVAARITPRTRAIMINSPHNPTGAIMDAEDMAHLERLAEQAGLWIISDEVYEHIVFDGRVHESICRYPELAKRSFVISSFGKSVHATGWKVGYCLAPRALTMEFRKVHQYVTFATCTPMQYAVARYLTARGAGEVFAELRAFYQAKHDLFKQLMAPSKFEYVPGYGTYFQLYSYKALSDESDMAYADWLVREAGVAAIPISVFYHDGYDAQLLRFCFAKKNETLQQAADILCSL